MGMERFNLALTGLLGQSQPVHSQPGTSHGVSRPPSSRHGDWNSKLVQSQLQAQFSLSFKGAVTNEAKNPVNLVRGIN